MVFFNGNIALKKMIQLSPNATVVDVRTAEEYNSGHFSGAVNIPLDQIQSRINEFKTMQMPVVVYCRSGARSGMAANILNQYGIQAMNAGGLHEMENLVR